jgi:pyruvate/2-oxoglutarate dehydrogenase complex dihydrolipoamide dehydrogenase (E3) component
MHETVTVEPADRHNRTLVENAHPPSWTNPEPSGRYNLVVVGAGTAGLVTAAGAAGLGAKVALVEKHLLGGDCLNVGCVPSKALIRAARAYADVRDAGEYGVVVPPGARADFEAVMERMRRLRASISHHDSARRFRELGVDVYLGAGKFTGSHSMDVCGKTLRFKKACIATGARAKAPPIRGLEAAGYLTNETVFSLTQLPLRLAVIGAGPIGCELSQAFARFGSRVTLLQSAERILARDDAEAASRVEAALRRDGIELICRARVLEASPGPAGKKIKFEAAGETRDVEVDEILVGVGRAPNVQGLGLEAAGVEYDEARGVRVDDRLRTSNPDIHAAGDICSSYQFTHTADALARIVIQNALFRGRARASALVVPWCTYTDPELAHVGMYPEEAERKGIKVATFTQEFGEVDRAVLDGDGGGLAKVHVVEGTDRILGATILARHAGEMLSEITLAMVGGLGLKALSKTIHPYPTQAEALRKLGDAYQRTRLKPWVKKLFKSWLAWTR